MLHLDDWVRLHEEKLMLWVDDAIRPVSFQDFKQTLKEVPGGFDSKMERTIGWLSEFAFVLHGLEVPQFLEQNGIHWSPPPPILTELSTANGRKDRLLIYEDMKENTEMRHRADIAVRMLLALRNELLQEAGLASLHEPDGEKALVLVNEQGKKEKSSRKQKNPQSTFEHFDQLFTDKGKAHDLIGLLQKVDPPALSATGGVLPGRGIKSAFIAWVEVMEAEGQINKVQNRKHLTKLLNERFSGLDLGKDGTLFDKVTTPMNSYKAKISMEYRQYSNRKLLF